MDMSDATLQEMVDAAESLDLPDPPGGAFKIHPREHRHLVAEAEPGTDAADVDYCAECWTSVSDDVCPECGSTERYDFEDA